MKIFSILSKWLLPMIMWLEHNQFMPLEAVAMTGIDLALSSVERLEVSLRKSLRVQDVNNRLL